MQGWALYTGLRWGHGRSILFMAVLPIVHGLDISPTLECSQTGLRSSFASQTQSTTTRFAFTCLPPWLSPCHFWSSLTHNQCSSCFFSPTIDLLIRKSIDVRNHTKTYFFLSLLGGYLMCFSTIIRNFWNFITKQGGKVQVKPLSGTLASIARV